MNAREKLNMLDKKTIIFLLLVFFLGIGLACNFSSNEIDVQIQLPTIKPTQTLFNDRSSQLRETPSPETQQVDTTIATATINVHSINKRSGPSGDFPSIGYAFRDDIFPVYAKNKDSTWLLIDIEESIWVAAAYVDMNIDIDLLPFVGEDLTFQPVSVPTIEITEVLQNVETAKQNTITDEIADKRIEILDFSDSNLEVLNISVYELENGNLEIFGEVKNKSNHPLKNIVVTSVLFDNNNSIKATSSNFVLVPWWYSVTNNAVLFPNERAPFAIHFSQPGTWDDINALVNYDIARDIDTMDIYREIKSSNSIGFAEEIHNTNFTIKGELENYGNSTCATTWIVATLFDNDGQVIGIDETVTDSKIIRPGESKPFEINLFARGKVASYILLYNSIRR